MALTVESFIAPAGRLTQDQYPNLDLEEAITAWMAEAALQADEEPAQAAWVYYRAFDTLASRLMSEAASESRGAASASRSESQLAHWVKERDRALAQYQALTGGKHTSGGVVPFRAGW